MPENQNIEYKSSWRDEYPVTAVREMIKKGVLVQSGTKGRGSKYIIGH